MISIFYFFVVLLTLVLRPEKYSYFDNQYNFVLGLIYFALVIIFFAHQRIKDKNWLRFDVLFLVGYTIVHFQIPFLASIGIEPSRPWHIWLNKEVVNYATWLSLLAISLWMFGYSLVKQPMLQIKPEKVNEIKIPILDLFLIVFLLGFLATAGKNFLGGAYDVNSWGGAATYFLMFLKSLIYLRIIYFFMKYEGNGSYTDIIKTAVKNKIFVGVVAAYFVLFFLTGSRGEILRVLLVTAFAYSIFIRHISFKFIIVSILVGAFIFTLMGMGRGRVATELADQGLLQRGYANFIEMEERKLPTEELASSVRILYRAIDVIPRQHDYLYGTPYLITAISPIPFSASLLISSFDVPYQYQATSRLFTYLGQGNNKTYGEGSEILADMYANFGIFGVLVLMFLFGVLSGLITKRSKRGDFNYMLIYVVLLITALSMNRGTIFYAYKEVFYILFLHAVFSGKLKWKK